MRRMKMTTRDMILISIFAVMTGIGRWIMIPMPFMPFTLQTLICMLSGLLLGSRRGAASQLLYMFMGLAGLPFFTTGAGPSAVVMPTFGYVMGFVVCAWVCGTLSKRCGYLAASLAGIAVMYLFGVSYLYFILNFWVDGGGASIWKVLSAGLFATVWVDAIKAVIASLVAQKLKKSGVLRF